MGKIRKKIAKIFVTIGLVSSLNLFMIRAQVAEKPEIKIEYRYENKDMLRKLKELEQTETPRDTLMKNIDIIRDFIASYAIINKMGQQNGLSNQDMLNILMTMNYAHEENSELNANGMFGVFKVSVENNNAEKFRNLIRNFNANINNIVITKEEFEQAKKELTGVVGDLFKKFLGEVNKALNKEDLNEIAKYININPNAELLNNDNIIEAIKAGVQEFFNKIEYNNDMILNIRNMLKINEKN